MKMRARSLERLLVCVLCLAGTFAGASEITDPALATTTLVEERSPEAERFAVSFVVDVARAAGLEVAAIDVFEAFREGGERADWIETLNKASQQAGLVMVDVSTWSPRDITYLRRPTLLLAREHQGEEAPLQPVRIDFDDRESVPPTISAAAFKPEPMEWARILPLLTKQAVVLVPAGDDEEIFPASKRRLRLGWGIAGAVCFLCAASGFFLFTRPALPDKRNGWLDSAQGVLVVAAPALLAAVAGVAVFSEEDDSALFTPDPTRPYELRSQEVREREDRYDVDRSGFETLLRERGPLLVDARSEDEYAEGTSPGSISLPTFDGASVRLRLAGVPHERPLIVFCSSRSCGRGRAAAAALRSAGFDEVYHYPPGWVELQKWRSAR